MKIIITNVKALFFHRFFLNFFLLFRKYLNKIESINLAKVFDIDKTTVLGRGVDIRSKDASLICIGKNSYILNYSLIQSFGGRITIGNNSSLNSFCCVYGYGDITIGSNVRIASHTVIVSGNHIFNDCNTLIRLQGKTREKITIKNDVWVGAGVRILAGVTIGKGSVIAAGSIITKDVPEYSVVAGSPGKILRNRCVGKK